MSERIEVIGGPWPERHGCRGHVVPNPGDGIYPFDKPLRGTVIVKLDDDPLAGTWTNWTCALELKNVRFLGSLPEEH